MAFVNYLFWWQQEISQCKLFSIQSRNNLAVYNIKVWQQQQRGHFLMTLILYYKALIFVTNTFSNNRVLWVMRVTALPEGRGWWHEEQYRQYRDHLGVTCHQPIRELHWGRGPMRGQGSPRRPPDIIWCQWGHHVTRLMSLVIWNTKQCHNIALDCHHV